MRIFGKRRKRTSTDSAIPQKEKSDAKPKTEGDDDEMDQTPLASEGLRQTDEKRDEVRSYFSPDFFSSVTPASASTSKNKIHDIQELLAMDPKCLTSKQRRLIRRHEERTGRSSSIKKQENNEKVVVDENLPHAEVSKQHNIGEALEGVDKQICANDGNDRKGEDVINNKVEEKEQKYIKSNSIPCAISSDKEMTKTTSENGDTSQKVQAPTHVTTNAGDNVSSGDKEQIIPFEEKEPPATSEKAVVASSSVLDQLKNLNSKERRKLLRKLAQESKVVTTDATCSIKAGNSSNSGDCDNESPKAASKLIVQAAEESRRVAAKNVAMMKEKMELQKKIKNKRKPEELDKPTKDKEDNGVQNNASKSKKRKVTDWSNLPPAERERREKQRQMQKEAAERRKAGEVLTRHPLNSERRRANRRKPGRAGKIALLKKETKEKLADMRSYNAGGYAMRHHSKNNRK